jgi:CheY-like chemotaxis protein
VVEDQEPMLEVILESLERLTTVEVIGLQNSKQAASLLSAPEHGFDLLLTNLNMPHLSGIKLIELAVSLTPKVPVMVLTGYPSGNTAQRCRELGACAYLTKPFDPHKLILRVQEVLLTRRGP